MPDLGGDLSVGADASGDDVAVTNPASCDPIGQDCVEQAASQCAFVHVPADVTASFACREPLGTAAAGEPCERPTGTVGEDTCGPGLFCAFWGLPQSTPQERQCLAFCNADNPCAGGGSCLNLDDGTWGVCAPSCDPLDDQCPAGTKCGSYFGQDPMFGPSWVWTCDFDSGAPVGTACESSLECGAGQTCVAGTQGCRPLCRTHGSGECTGTDVCSPFAPVPGACFSHDWSCVDSVTVPPVSAPETTVQLQVTEFALFPPTVPVVGAAVKACAAADIDCSAPIDSQTTDAGGLATLTVPTGTAGFDGYFEVVAVNFATTLAYAEGPLTESVAQVGVGLLPSDFSAFWPGVALDATRGAVLAYVSACTPGPSPFPDGAGVTISSAERDGPTATGYLNVEVGEIFDTSKADTMFYAIAGLANHLPGPATLTFVNRTPVTVAERSVLVRPSAVTTVHVAPTP